MKQDILNILFESASSSYREVGKKFEEIIELSYREFLNEGDIAIDLGSHWARHTWPMCEAVGESGKVYAFEAINRIYVNMLVEQLKQNINNVSFYNVAVADVRKRVAFKLFNNNEEYSGIVGRKDLDSSFYDKVEEVFMLACPIDEILPDSVPVKYIKMDIEGGEFHALKGAKKLISRQRPIIVFENGRQKTADMYGYSKEEFWTFFNGIGYLLFDISGAKFDQSDWDKPFANWNYFAVPLERQDVINKLPQFILSLI